MKLSDYGLKVKLEFKDKESIWAITPFNSKKGYQHKAGQV